MAINDSEESQGRVYDQQGRDITDAALPTQLRELIDLERQRIVSYDKRTDVAKAAVDANSQADERQFQFHMEKLRVEDDREKRTLALAKSVLFVGGGLVAVVLFGLLALTFFGTDAQSALAFQVLKVLFTGLAGFGVVSALLRAIRSFANRQ